MVPTLNLLDVVHLLIHAFVIKICSIIQINLLIF